MQVINASRVSKGKIKMLLRKHIGAKPSFFQAFRKGGVGIAGMEYAHGVDVIDDDRSDLRLLCNFESRENGIVVYLNNPEESYVFIIEYSELRSISFRKYADKVDVMSGSPFDKAMDKDISYAYKRVLLLEDEIIEFNNPVVTITLEDDTRLQWEVTRRDYGKVLSYLQQIPTDLPLVVDVQEFTQ